MVVWRIKYNNILLVFSLFIDAVKTALDVVETGLDVAVDTKNYIEDRIKDAIEGFRKQMAAGIEILGIPKLDPLEIHHFDFHVNHDIGKLVLLFLR